MGGGEEEEWKEGGVRGGIISEAVLFYIKYLRCHSEYLHHHATQPGLVL